MTINDIKIRLNNIADETNIYEPDTIERLIIPVINIAGWDVDSINPMYLKRGNQNTKGSARRFDIELYCPQEMSNPRFVFECKRLNANILVMGKGASSNTADDTDYVRQLRNYCLDPKFNFSSACTVPILSNGKKWIIFKPAFSNRDHANENITTDNYSDFIAVEANLTDEDFETKIIKILKYCCNKCN